MSATKVQRKRWISVEVDEEVRDALADKADARGLTLAPYVRQVLTRAAKR
jgi:hypothetical protein